MIAVGNVFDRLTVIQRDWSNSGPNAVWLCRCSCGSGADFATTSSNLLSGNTRSCGCLRSESNKRRFTTHGASSCGKRTPEYRVWQAMISRCHNAADPAFRHYGMRDIYVCRKWRESFTAFILDMGTRPSHLHTLERTNNSQRNGITNL